MNLINLPMVESVVHRKMLTGSSDAQATSGDNKSTRGASGGSKRFHVPDGIAAELQQFGVHKKARRDDVEPTEKPEQATEQDDEPMNAMDPMGPMDTRVTANDGEVVAPSCSGTDAPGGKPRHIHICCIQCTHEHMITTPVYEYSFILHSANITHLHVLHMPVSSLILII